MIATVGGENPFNIGINHTPNKCMPNVRTKFEIKAPIENSQPRTVGIGTIRDPNNEGIAYGMVATWASDSTEENPIIQVTAATPSGEHKEYKIEINQVNPCSATELEMFAYCNYLDFTGQGAGSSFGSWVQLKILEDDVVQEGYFEDTCTIDDFDKIKQDWISLITKVKAKYMEDGIFKSVLDADKLLNLFSKANNNKS